VLNSTLEILRSEIPLWLFWTLRSSSIESGGPQKRSASAWMDCHLVEYFNPDTYSGEVGPFRKPSSFEYQQEFRIIITPGTVEPVKLKVGNLKDITTTIYSLADINKLVEFNLPKRELSQSELGGIAVEDQPKGVGLAGLHPRGPAAASES
jgi:hypothetical protein